MSDVQIKDEGTIIGFTPLTEAGRDFIGQKVYSEPWQWMGGTLYVDHGCAEAVIEGMQEDGLVVDRTYAEMPGYWELLRFLNS